MTAWLDAMLESFLSSPTALTDRKSVGKRV
jgi:hypothetical protein